jgi:OOP family OmpA-OmpF porin
MRKLAVGLASVAVILSSPALAQDRAPYIGVEIGAMMVNDMAIDVGADDNAVTVEHDFGYDGRLFVGYDLGGFRVEGEVAYKKANLESYQTTIRLPFDEPDFPTEGEARGSSTALSYMINGIRDFGGDDGISGFVGVGGGEAEVTAVDYRNRPDATPFFDASDSGFAWQVFAGARRPISDNIDVTVRYNFFNVDGLNGVAFNGNETERRFRSHSVTAGVTFNFGGS